MSQQHLKNFDNNMKQMPQQKNKGGQMAQPHRRVENTNQDLVTINKWNKLRSELKVLPASSLGIHNPNKDSECFWFSPKSIDGLNYQPKSREVKTLAIKFNFSFFTNYKDQKQFFGRTYLTGAYYLRKEQQGYTFQFEHPHPFSLFFHSQLEKSSQTQLLFEAYILEIGNHDIIYNTFPCGVGEINILSFLKESQSVALKNTTMRQFVSNYSSDQRLNLTDVRISFIFDQFYQLNRIKNLFPESVIISSNDHIPGVADIWSDDKESKTLKIDKAAELMMITLPTYKVCITHVQITFRESVERELVRQVQQFLEVSKSVDKKVIFKEKKLICGFHNGWEFVNRGGSQNRVTLKQGPRQSIIDEEGHEVSLVSLEYSGMHEIDNVFDSDSSVIILQLEYDIEYIAQARQIATRVISWLPVSITGKLSTQKEISIKEGMLHGPGKSVDGQRMISLPYRDEFDVKVNANFRIIPPGANQIQLYEEIQQNRQLQSEQRGQMQQQNMPFSQQQIHQPGFQDMKKQQMMQQQHQPYNNQGFQQQNMPYPQQPYNNQQPFNNQQPYNNQSNMRFGQASDQFMQRRPQEFTGGVGYQLNPSELITWEPRDEKERVAKNLQQQVLMMSEQLQHVQREKEQIQLNLTQEYKQMREELIKSRNSQNASSESFHKRSKHSPLKNQSNNYEQDDQVDYDHDQFDGSQLDFNPVRSKVIFQNKEKPLIVHLNQPAFGKRELSKKDKMNLIDNNVPGLLDDVPLTDNQNVDEKELLEKDMKNNLKASYIVFRILSFKPNTYQGVPKRMYITLNFFDFPKFQTESFSYESKDDKNTLLKLIDAQSPIVLYREAFLKGEEDKYLSFKFEVDPSKSRYDDLFKDFVNYLAKKQLHIDIWDADTLMLYGSSKIPLNSIRRGGMNRKTCQLDLEIVNMTFIGSRGSIQIQIDNIGREESNKSIRKEKEEQQQLKEKQEQEAIKINLWQNKQIQKAKVVSDKAILIPQNFLKNQNTNAVMNVGIKQDKNNKTEIKAEDKDRQMERVKRFKNATLNQAALLFEAEDQNRMLQKMSLGFDTDKIKDLSYHRIQKIDEIKNRKKPEYVKSVISKFLNEEKILPVTYGKQEIVHYLLQNQTKEVQTYTIGIEDSDDQVLPYDEFEIIEDETEWKYWCEHFGYPEPSNYKILSGNSLVLNQEEKVTIMFKFMTYRNIDPQLKDKPDAERIASQRDENYRLKYINPRSINVFFYLKQQTVGGFKLKVEPHQQVIDHIFRYYEKSNKAVNITLPPLYLKNQPPMLKPSLHVTNNQVQLAWINENELAIFTKLPNTSKIMKFNILIYGSDFRSNLLSNIQVELHALEGVDIHVNMGQTQQFKLHVPGDIPRVIRLHSSQPEILWFQPPYDATFILPPGKITQIDSNVKSLTTNQQRLQINAVDVHSNELVHSWIVRVETDVPQPTKVYELKVTACKESNHVFEYNNKSGKAKTFQFLSSDPSILEIIDSSKQILGHSGEEISVKVMANDYNTSESQVIVFVSDFDEKIFETLKFRIRYQFNEEAQSLNALNKLKKNKDLILQSQQQQNMYGFNQSTVSQYENYNQRSPQKQYASGNNYNDYDAYGATGQSFYQNDNSNNNYQNYQNNQNQGNYKNYGQGNQNNYGQSNQNNYENYNKNNQNDQGNQNNYGNYNNYDENNNHKNKNNQNNNYKNYNNNQNNDYPDYSNNNQYDYKRQGGNNDQHKNRQQSHGRNEQQYSGYDNYDQGQDNNYNSYQNQGNKKVSFKQEGDITNNFKKFSKK